MLELCRHQPRDDPRAEEEAVPAVPTPNQDLTQAIAHVILGPLAPTQEHVRLGEIPASA